MNAQLWSSMCIHLWVYYTPLIMSWATGVWSTVHIFSFLDFLFYFSLPEYIMLLFTFHNVEMHLEHFAGPTFLTMIPNTPTTMDCRWRFRRNNSLLRKKVCALALAYTFCLVGWKRRSKWTGQRWYSATNALQRTGMTGWALTNICFDCTSYIYTPPRWASKYTVRSTCLNVPVRKVTSLTA